MKLKDLTGKEYGYLKVIKRYGTHIRPSGAKFVTWLCRCCCGKEVVVVGYALKNGTTKSCGCKRFLHPLNETMEDDNFIYISVKDKTVIIDKEDYSKIFPYRVYIGKHGYPVANNTPIHRLILNPTNGKVIDHINHDKLDNRKQNLRMVTHSENMVNRKITSNTGELGISKTKKGYYVITVDGKYVGITKTLDEAIIARNKALKGTRQEKYNYFV